DIHQCAQQTCQHTGNRATVVHPLGEDTHHQCREDRRCGNTERQSYRLCGETGWVQTQPGGQQNGNGHGDTGSHQFTFLTDIRLDHILDQVVGYRRGNGEQQTGSGRQCSRNTTGSNQTDYPARQTGNFRVSQYHDVVVNGQLVTVPTTLGSGVGKVSVFVVVHLDTAIAVFVFKFHQTSFFPGLDPLKTFSVFQRRGAGVGTVVLVVVVHLAAAIAVVVFTFPQTSFFPGLDPLRTFSVFQRRSTGAFRIHGVHQVQTSHGTYGRSSQVQHGNKHPRP